MILSRYLARNCPGSLTSHKIPAFFESLNNEKKKHLQVYAFTKNIIMTAERQVNIA